MRILLNVKDLQQWLKLLKQQIFSQDDIEGIWGSGDLPTEKKFRIDQNEDFVVGNSFSC